VSADSDGTNRASGRAAGISVRRRPLTTRGIGAIGTGGFGAIGTGGIGAIDTGGTSGGVTDRARSKQQPERGAAGPFPNSWTFCVVMM
jgi:hypothetical protein